MLASLTTPGRVSDFLMVHEFLFCFKQLSKKIFQIGSEIFSLVQFWAEFSIELILNITQTFTTICVHVVRG